MLFWHGVTRFRSVAILLSASRTRFAATAPGSGTVLSRQQSGPHPAAQYKYPALQFADMLSTPPFNCPYSSMSGRAVFVLVLVVLALAWVGYCRPPMAPHFLPRGASTLTAHEIAAARAAMRQPLLARAGLVRGDFRQAMDLLMFDGLSAGGDSAYTVALDADARAALARQIAIDAELALA
ncbi:MAG: hypothetical protein EBU92_12160, partial [Betaproteobacteria bacterium]|nr:hypothetical protein [Betaproteobacteria bacterium]